MAFCLKTLAPYSISTLSTQPQADLHAVQLDQCWSSFAEQASQAASIASMGLGSLTYQLARASLLQVGSRLGTHFARHGLRFFTPLLSLSAEVSVYESSHRLLSSPHTSSSDLSLSDTWKISFANFSLLKSAGYLLGHQNIFFRHLGQDLAMVAGNHLGAFLHWMPEAQGSLLQQLMQSEALNLSLEAGMLGAHRVLGGRLNRMQQVLEFRSQRISEVFTQPASLLRAHAEMVEMPADITRWLNDLRGPEQRKAVEAFYALKRVLLGQRLSPNLFLEVFCEFFNPERSPHPELQVDWLALPQELMEKLDFNRRGPRTILESLAYKSEEGQVSDAAAGIYNGLLRNPSLNASQREAVSQSIAKIWEVEEAQDLNEARENAFQACVDALEAPHVEEWIGEQILEDALNFAEDHPAVFANQVREEEFIPAILATEFVTGYNQRRLVNLILRVVADPQMELYSGQRFSLFENLEKMAEDNRVPSCIRAYIRSKISNIEDALPDLLKAEFEDEKTVVQNAPLISRMALRPSLDEETRIHLLLTLYFSLKPYNQVYRSIADFALEHHADELLGSAGRCAVMTLLLKVATDMSHSPPRPSRMVNAVEQQSLIALRERVKKCLRDLNNEERDDLMNFIIALDMEGDTERPDIPALLGRNVSYMRNTQAYGEFLQACLKKDISPESRRRIRLILSLLSAN